MGVYYKDVCAVCPFYLKGNADSIQCEGFECTAIKLLFTDEKGKGLREKRDEYSSKYCENNYEDCKYYNVINSKYGG